MATKTVSIKRVRRLEKLDNDLGGRYVGTAARSVRLDEIKADAGTARLAVRVFITA
jgi:hypothetical protein